MAREGVCEPPIVHAWVCTLVTPALRRLRVQGQSEPRGGTPSQKQTKKGLAGWLSRSGCLLLSLTSPHLKNPDGGRKKQTPSSCPLTYTYTKQHPHEHTRKGNPTQRFSDHHHHKTQASLCSKDTVIILRPGFESVLFLKRRGWGV